MASAASLAAWRLEILVRNHAWAPYFLLVLPMVILTIGIVTGRARRGRFVERFRGVTRLPDFSWVTFGCIAEAIAF
jgi:hypothetical protein